MKLKDKVERIFFPQRCPVCHDIIPIEKDECDCQGSENSVISDDFCFSCAADKTNCSCAVSHEGEPLTVAGVYYYSGKIRSQIALFKFAGKKHFANSFAMKMSERVARVYSDVKFDAVTFVPSSQKSLEQRGYNQSQLLAKIISEKLFLPLEETLVKVKETEYQHNLGAKERLKNLENAFELKDGKDVKGKTVLLCDDIKTTGTTLRRCSKVLYQNGAANVCCIVLAVTDFLTDF